MTDATDFPGARGEWARFDGPAGTQMVASAIDAMSQWSRSGNNANSGGVFAAAQATDELLSAARAAVGDLLNAPARNVCFGANMTTMTLAFTRAVGETLHADDHVIGTRLDHDANVMPWRIAAERAGAAHVLVPFDPANGRLDPAAVVAAINERTKWVSLPGASNLIGTIPDLQAIIRAAHEVGARVFVDAVHLVPHQRVDTSALGADVVVTSAYKWYGPHAAAMVVADDLLDTLPVAKVRPAANVGARRWETGTPNLEALAGVRAAAEYLVSEGVERVADEERAVFAPLLDGLVATRGVRVHGPTDLVDRTPTVAFTVDGIHPDEVARRLADHRIAVWAGHSYAVEVADQLGLSDLGGVVRAGVVRYVSHDDVQRLLRAVEEIAVSRG